MINLNTQQGTIPQVRQGYETPGLRPLYHDKKAARIIEATIAPGFGILKAGTIMAENASAAGNKGKLVPYVPDSVVAASSKDPSYIGAAFLVQTPGATDAFVYVTLKDSYKFIIGDDIIVAYGTTRTNGGAITAIDRTTNPHMAKITFTSALSSGTDYTPAAGAHCYVESGASGKLCAAKYILDQDIDTGDGDRVDEHLDGSSSLNPPLGALASILLGGAIIYKGSLVNYDAQVLTDIGTTIMRVIGRFIDIR